MAASSAGSCLLYKKASPHGSASAPPLQSCVIYFCPRERPRSSQRTLCDSQRHPTTINPAMPRLQGSSTTSLYPRWAVAAASAQPRALPASPLRHPAPRSRLTAVTGPGQVPTRTRCEAYLSIMQPGVIQSSATLEKGNLNEPSTRNKTKSTQKTGEHQVAPIFSYKDLIQL